MFDNRAQVLADAHRDAMLRGSYHDDSPLDPDAVARESIAAIAPVAPSAGVAAALLGAASVRPVPLDWESLEPTADPLPDLAAVDAHWRVNHTDGVGVRAGIQANGSAIFALRGTLAALRGWLADVGTEPDEIRNEHGNVVSSSRTYRPVTPFVQVGWSAPPTRSHSIVSFGAGLLDSLGDMRSDKRDNERALASTAWLAWTVGTVWTVAPDERQRRLVVRSHRLAKGIDVVGEGDVIPWHVRRYAGWTCAALNMPIAGDEPLSPWLSDAFGASWKKSP